MSYAVGPMVYRSYREGDILMLANGNTVECLEERDFSPRTALPSDTIRVRTPFGEGSVLERDVVAILNIE